MWQHVNWDGVGKTGNRETRFEDFSSNFGATWWGKRIASFQLRIQTKQTKKQINY